LRFPSSSPAYRFVSGPDRARNLPEYEIEKWEVFDMEKGSMRTVLSKQNCRRLFCVFLVILMAFTILPLNPAVYASDEFDSLREKYRF
jgi:hypothetical protein